MNAENFFEIVTLKFGEKIVETVEPEFGDPYAVVEAGAIAEVCKFFASDPELEFTSLMCLSGVDHDEENLRVVYNLNSMKFKHSITLHVIVPKSKPVIPTVSSVWETADWHEREAFDMFGFTFKGHPDHRRMLLPDDWEGFPLRKDYQQPNFYNEFPIPYPGQERDETTDEATEE